ncbi:MAG TPA: protease complex subunit PrcB family protein, partial [Alphaproteobacteria bacterium]|nr:protease complex subunit PrcB family protein [Alphaproteobacteria bacterium]
SPHRLTWAAAALALSACGPGALFGEDDHVEEPVPLDGPATPLAPGPAIDGRTEWSGPNATATADVFVTARDDQGWRTLWQLAGTAPPAPLPEGAMAVAVFLGQRPTSGYTVELGDVVRRGEAVIVSYRETQPAPDAVVSQALTSPYAVRLVAETEAPVRYRLVEDDDGLGEVDEGS